MKKKLTNKLTLYKTNYYPYKAKYTSYKPYEVTVAIGGNKGNTKQIFHKLFICLQSDTRFDILKTSPLLKNPPFGYLNQNDFLNGIITLKTNLSANAFLKAMQDYERRFKRQRSFKNAPRTLDIDIIFYANQKINSEKLTVPHQGWSHRDCVLIPLSRMYK